MGSERVGDLLTSGTESGVCFLTPGSEFFSLTQDQKASTSCTATQMYHMCIPFGVGSGQHDELDENNCYQPVLNKKQKQQKYMVTSK